MKKSEKKNLFNEAFNTLMPIVKTAASGFNPLIGMAIGAVEGTVKAVKNEKEKNLSTQTGGEGKTNYSMMIGQIVSGVVIIGGCIGLIMGWITIDDIKALIRLWEQTQ